MDEQEYEIRVKNFLRAMQLKGVPPDVAAHVLMSTELAEKAADAYGIAYKSYEAPRLTLPNPVEDSIVRWLQQDGGNLPWR